MTDCGRHISLVGAYECEWEREWKEGEEQHLGLVLPLLLLLLLSLTVGTRISDPVLGERTYSSPPPPLPLHAIALVFVPGERAEGGLKPQRAVGLSSVMG